MTTVTVQAGSSGVMEEVVFGSPGSSATQEERHGGAVPTPYDYVLMALGA